MKRSAVIGTTAMIAGLLLAITAFAAPFRDYDRAAGDQYTTTTVTPTTTTSPTTTTPPTTTVGATVTVGGQSTTGGPTTVDTTGTTGTTPGTTDDEPTTDTDTSSPGGEDDGAGAAPDEDLGAGAPTGSGGGTGAGRGTGDGRGTIAFLTITTPPTNLGPSVLKVIGIPAWLASIDPLSVNTLGDIAAGTPFAGIGEGDLDMDKLRGLAKRLGGESVQAVGLSRELPDLLRDFEGLVKPLTGLVLAHQKLDDADDRAIAEAFQRSFARGAVLADIPVIGVELKDSDPSSISYFKKIKGVSSVDNIDTATGQESLMRLLGGAKPGHYGSQKDADALQPPRIVPDTAAAPVTDGSGSLSGSPLLVGLLLTMALLSGRALVTVTRRARAGR